MQRENGKYFQLLKISEIIVILVITWGINMQKLKLYGKLFMLLMWCGKEKL